MKKFLSIFLLIGAMMVGGISADAKTPTKKRTSASTTKVATPATLSLSTFSKKQSGSKFREFLPVDKVEASLKKLGFSCDSRKVTKEYDEMMGEEMDIVKFSYSKDGVTITFDNSYTIKFSDSAKKEAFLGEIKAQGYKFYKDFWDGCYMIPGNDQEYWNGVFVFDKGNSIVISAGAE